MSVVSNVQMEEFISWFEFQLAKCLAVELRQLNDSLSFMFGILNFLKIYGSKLSQPQSAGGPPRKAKPAGDQVDAILSQFGSAPPLLPHNEFVEEFLHKLRKKFKLTPEDFDSNCKFTRDDLRSLNTNVSTNTVIASLLSEAETLEFLKSKQFITCNYLSEIKSQVHSPLLTLLQEHSSLPTANDSADVYTASQLLHSAESAYAAARSIPIFVQIATCKQEAEYIELAVADMLSPLLQAAKTISKHSHARSESVWSRSLLPLLACPTGELLARCCHASAMESFASSVVELQSVLKNPPPTDGGKVPVSNRRAQLFSEIAEDVLVGIEVFDIELFAAYVDDWRVRVCDIEVRSTSAEFEKRYKELMKLRVHCKKAADAYDKKLQTHNAMHEHYNGIRSQLHMMKLKLQEICLSELKETVDIILPEDRLRMGPEKR